MRRVLLSLSVVAVLVTPSAFAQVSAAGPNITRADLAEAYLRLDFAMGQADLEGEALGDANKQFDAATLAFFSGKLGDAIAQIDNTTLNIMEEYDNAALRYALSLRASVSPDPFIRGTKILPQVSLETLYTPEGDTGDAGEPVTLRARDASGAVVSEVTLDGPRNGMTTVSFPAGSGLAVGRYTLDIDTGTATPIRLGQWTVTDHSFDSLRETNAADLENVKVSGAALEQAKAAVLARNALLSDSPSAENTAQFVFDPNTLADEIASEIAALQKGEDPFNQRRGDYWRVFQPATGDPIPLRVYVPEGLDLDTPQPLVVAFHGAGGDENMFMDAYGVGEIKSLADKRGFVLVTPLTYAFTSGTGEKFDALLEAIHLDYPIDKGRIYVLGHSMGGGITTAVISARPGVVAAASPICGFRTLPATVTALPPTYVIAAEFDPLAKAPAVEAAAKAAQTAGLPVEFQLIKNYGHTLVVGHILPTVIDWLFTH